MKTKEIKKQATAALLALLSTNNVRKFVLNLYSKRDELLPIMKKTELLANAIRWKLQRAEK